MKPNTLIQQTAVSAQGSKWEAKLQVVGATGDSKLKTDSEEISMFPRTYWWKGLQFSPAEWQSPEGKIHQLLGGTSKRRWSFWEPPSYGLLSGLSRPGGACNENRIRRKNLDSW